MKIKLIAILVFVVAGTLYATPPWHDYPPYAYHWIVLEDLPPENIDFRFLVRAQSKLQELLYYNEQSFVTHDEERSYFTTSGYIDSAEHTVIFFPPYWNVFEDLDNGYTYKYKRINFYAGMR